ncbi:hypothetical protein PspLS_06997 [Pyricularia sp. CBS 133598]|nr:hypothetical protein PspLS_06997 [Pyricularia sp. CBS 133598]
MVDTKQSPDPLLPLSTMSIRISYARLPGSRSIISSSHLLGLVEQQLERHAAVGQRLIRRLLGVPDELFKLMTPESFFQNNKSRGKSPKRWPRQSGCLDVVSVCLCDADAQVLVGPDSFVKKIRKVTREKWKALHLRRRHSAFIEEQVWA